MTGGSLAEAIATFFGAICGFQVDAAEADLSAPLFDPRQPALASDRLDSLAIAEALVALEQELGIEILGRAEAEDLHSVAAIAAFAARSSSPERTAAFARRWASALSRG